MPIELESLLSQFWKLSYLKRDYNRTVPMNVNIETLRPRWPFFCLDWQRGTHTKNYTFSVFPTEILMIFSINRIWWDNHCTIKKKKDYLWIKDGCRSSGLLTAWSEEAQGWAACTGLDQGLLVRLEIKGSFRSRVWIMRPQISWFFPEILPTLRWLSIHVCLKELWLWQ